MLLKIFLVSIIRLACAVYLVKQLFMLIMMIFQSVKQAYSEKNSEFSFLLVLFDHCILNSLLKRTNSVVNGLNPGVSVVSLKK